MGYEQAFVRMSLKVCENTWPEGYILRNGELGILRITEGALDDIGKVELKIGDGSTSWDKLPLPNNVTSFSMLVNKVEDLETRLIAMESKLASGG